MAAAPKAPRVTSVVRRRDIIERRLKNPNASEAMEIPSRPAGRWKFRVVNSKISNDHVWRMNRKNGWEFASPEDIDAPYADFGLELSAGRLVMGERGAEILMKMDSQEWHDVQQAKSDANRRQALSVKDIPQRAAESFGGSEGSEAADVLHRSLEHVTVTERLERVRATDYEAAKE